MSTATLHTTEGDTVIEPFDGEASITVTNFVGLVGGTKEYRDPNTGEIKTGKFHNGLGFHCVIGGFMTQGGCPPGTRTGGPGYRFTDELHPKLSFNHPYPLAMANVRPGTDDPQLFITMAPTPHLNRRHTILDEVKDPASQAVVDAIATMETDHRDRPTIPIVISPMTLP